MNQTKNSTTTLQEFQQKRTEKNKEEKIIKDYEKIPHSWREIKEARDIYSGFNEWVHCKENKLTTKHLIIDFQSFKYN